MNTEKRKARTNDDDNSTLTKMNVCHTIVILIFVLFVRTGEAIGSENIEPATQAVPLSWYNDVTIISTLTYRLQATSSTTCQNAGKVQTTITEIDQVFSLSIHPNVASKTFNLFFRTLEEIIKVNGTKVNLPY